MKQSQFLYIFLGLVLSLQSVYAQLDSIHWIPPLHSRHVTNVEDHYVYLSTPKTTPFVVTIRNGSGTILATPTISNTSPFKYLIGNGQVSGSPAFVPLDSLNKSIKNSGLVISAPQVFYANLRVQSAFQAECLSAKGRAALGTIFRFGAWPQAVNGGSFRNFTAGIMATEDNTMVTISDYDSGVIFTDKVTPISLPVLNITLNKGECYVIAGNTDIVANRSGFIGALIKSDKPIVLNNGNICGSVQIAGPTQIDIGLDQSVPINKIGQDYILVEGEGTGTLFEQPIVIAHYDSTEIFVNGNVIPITTINAGQYFVVPFSNYLGTSHNNMYVRTSRPVYMYQALLASTSERTNGLNFIPAFGCFLKDTINMIPAIDSIGTIGYTAGVMLYTHAGATVRINGVVQDSAVSVTGIPWETYKIKGLTGNINITSTKGVAAGIFGYSGLSGYAAYYAGFSERLTLDTLEDTLICSGQSISLIVQTNMEGAIYSWTPSVGLSENTIPNPIASPITTTNYIVEITNSKGCSIFDTISIVVNPSYLMSEIKNICQGDSVLINGAYYYIAGVYKDNFPTNLGCDSIIETTLNYDVSNCDVYIPNVFSPNGDGENDVFRVLGDGIASLNMKIYNRWGSLVYEGNSLSEGWDGKHKNGNPHPAGVYLYMLKVGKDKTVYRGTITLIR